MPSSPADAQAAEICDAYWNKVYPEPQCLGEYPAAMRAAIEPFMQAGDLARIKRPLDWFGLNHYSPVFIKADANARLGFTFGDRPAGTPVTPIDWPIMPDAFRDTLLTVAKRYALPVYVLENGLGNHDMPDAAGAVIDNDRIDFLRAYIGAVNEAAAAGADIRGYFVWSLLDNFEWDQGYSVRFGLTYIDYPTQKRIPKALVRLVPRADQASRRQVMTERILLGDVGGTNARFAVLSDGALGPIDHLRVAEYARFEDALAAYLKLQHNPAIGGALFAVAGVVHGERCELTNNAWVVDAAALRARFGFSGVHLINDFEAVAWSLPNLKSKDLRQLGGGKAVPGAPMLAIGPGTGLGVAAYVPTGKTGRALMSEGGHTTLPSGSVREDAIIATLRQSLGHVSAERVLSGPGLERLYRTIATLDGVTVPDRPAREITKAGIDGSCAVSRAALDTFCAMLGEVAGNFALAFGAQGGVFIGGGFVPRMRDYLPGTQLRARFDAKGRMSAYVAGDSGLFDPARRPGLHRPAVARAAGRVIKPSTRGWLRLASQSSSASSNVATR